MQEHISQNKKISFPPKHYIIDEGKLLSTPKRAAVLLCLSVYKSLTGNYQILCKG